MGLAVCRAGHHSGRRVEEETRSCNFRYVVDVDDGREEIRVNILRAAAAPQPCGRRRRGKCCEHVVYKFGKVFVHALYICTVKPRMTEPAKCESLS